MKIYRPVKQPIMRGKQNGNNGKKVYPPFTKRYHLKSSEDVRRLLSGVINNLLQQRIDPIVARGVVYASQVLLTTFELRMIETDIKALTDIAREHYGYGG
jgi:hypothetical protein